MTQNTQMQLASPVQRAARKLLTWTINLALEKRRLKHSGQSTSIEENDRYFAARKELRGKVRELKHKHPQAAQQVKDIIFNVAENLVVDNQDLGDDVLYILYWFDAKRKKSINVLKEYTHVVGRMEWKDLVTSARERLDRDMPDISFTSKGDWNEDREDFFENLNQRADDVRYFKAIKEAIRFMWVDVLHLPPENRSTRLLAGKEQSKPVDSAATEVLQSIFGDLSSKRNKGTKTPQSLAELLKAKEEERDIAAGKKDWTKVPKLNDEIAELEKKLQQEVAASAPNLQAQLKELEQKRVKAADAKKWKLVTQLNTKIEQVEQKLKKSQRDPRQDQLDTWEAEREEARRKGKWDHVGILTNQIETLTEVLNQAKAAQSPRSEPIVLPPPVPYQPQVVEKKSEFGMDWADKLLDQGVSTEDSEESEVEPYEKALDNSAVATAGFNFNIRDDAEIDDLLSNVGASNSTDEDADDEEAEVEIEHRTQVTARPKPQPQREQRVTPVTAQPAQRITADKAVHSQELMEQWIEENQQHSRLADIQAFVNEFEDAVANDSKGKKNLLKLMKSQ